MEVGRNGNISADKGIYVGVAKKKSIKTEESTKDFGGLFSSNKTAYSKTTKTTHSDGSALKFDGEVKFHSKDGEIRFTGVTVDAKTIGAKAKKGVKLLNAKETTECTESRNRTNQFLFFNVSSKTEKKQCYYEDAVATKLNADFVYLDSDQNVEIRSSKVNANKTFVRAKNFKITFDKLASTTKTDAVDSNFLLETRNIEVSHKEKLDYSGIKGNVDTSQVDRIDISSVQLDIDPNAPLTEQLQLLSEQPGMAWIDKIKDHPRINLYEVELALEKWEQSHTQISPQGRVLISIAVAAATQGTGSILLNSVLPAMAQVSGPLAAAANAGFTALTNKAAQSLVDNQGDLTQVFDDLFNSSTLEELAVVVLTSGLVSGTETSLAQASADAGTEAAKSALDTFGKRLRSRVIRVTAKSYAEGLIQGKKPSLLEWNDFQEALTGTAVDVLGPRVANEIGQAYKQYIASQGGRDALSYLLHKVGHGALGCQLSRLSNGSCEAGAFGAVFTEVLLDRPEYDLEQFATDLIDQNSDLRQRLGSDDLAVKQQALDEVLDLTLAFRARGVQISKLATAFGAMLAGFDAKDMQTAIDTGVNAAENNAFWVVIDVIYKAAVAGAAIYEAYELYLEIEQASPERRQEIAKELLYEYGLGRLTGGKVGREVLEKLEDFLGEGPSVIIDRLRSLAHGDQNYAVAGVGDVRTTLNGKGFDADPNFYKQGDKATASGSRTGGNRSALAAKGEVYYKTTKEAAEAAKKHGYIKIKERVRGEAVFFNKKRGEYITRDIGSGDGNGSHIGGVWKVADSIQGLKSKRTRLATLDANMKEIGK